MDVRVELMDALKDVGDHLIQRALVAAKVPEELPAVPRIGSSRTVHARDRVAARMFGAALSPRTNIRRRSGEETNRRTVPPQRMRSRRGSAHRRFERELVLIAPVGRLLGLRDERRSALVIAPLGGVEWQVTDRWNVSFTPRAQVMLGGVRAVAVLLPFSVGYSWYRW